MTRSQAKSPADAPRQTRLDTVCPASGLAVTRRPEWTDVQLDEDYWVTVEVIGRHIVHSIPSGHATKDGVAKVNAIHNNAIQEAIEPDTSYVYVADYSNFKGSTLEGRRLFSEVASQREGLAALIFHDVSPLLTLSIKLGRRFLGPRKPVEIAADHETAIRRALEILKENGVEGLPLLDEQPETDPQFESGAMDLDDYRVRYEIVDDSIIHGRSAGFLGLKSMERHIELENMILASLNPSRGNPVMVADLSKLEGISAAARRLYVAAVKNRQRVTPIALFVCHGAGPKIRTAINISRPFLPFRIRIARDETTALQIARSNTSTPKSSVGRIRSVLHPKATGNRPAHADHI
ncbi:MAG: hypothetical protein V2I67_03275, partial [Thermoanaerobaculales bacterium]|nr:hypothetical protein [Thermoanaerobaculales bacterium]